MYDVIGGANHLRRQVTRRRADRSLRRLGRDLDTLRRDLYGVRADVYRGVVVKEARRLADTVADALPIERRRHTNLALVSAPVVAFVGLAAVAGLLLWDERRRAAMRRRLEEVAGTVTSNLQRATSSTPSGASSE